MNLAPPRGKPLMFLAPDSSGDFIAGYYYAISVLEKAGYASVADALLDQAPDGGRCLVHSKASACRKLKVSERTLDRAIDQGKLRCHRLGIELRFSDAALEEFRKKRRKPGRPKKHDANNA